MNIPKLRFKEFTDEWVYYKYKDIFNLNQGLQIPITERFLDYAPNRFFYITNEFLKPSSKKSYYIENPSPNVICTKEDILMTRTGNTGKVITNIAGVFHNNFFRIKYNPKNFNKDFICCVLNQNKIQNKILTLAGSSTIPDLNHKDFYSIKSRFPKLKEQEKIAKFINTVDKKIENIENTISSLENQKKGLLQQIFSQKLRFKDENGNNYPNWEKKKLGDIGSFSRGGNLSKSDLSKKGTSCILYGELYTYYNEFATEIKSKTLNTTNLVLSKKYDVLLPLSGETAEDISTCTCIFFDDIALGSDLLIFRSSFFDGRFMSLLLKYKYKYKIAQIAQGKSIVHISEKNIKNINIKIPCIEEQQNIADFILIFTKKLENQKAQLKHWKQIKKGLLQQMFI